MAILKTALVYFDQAIRDGSIRKAADNLHIASSAVNRQILQLESELGVELFERLPRGIRATAAGEALLGHIRRWNRDAHQLRQEIGRLQGGVRGTISIAAAESLTVEILPAAMTKLQAVFPLIDFSLISGDNYLIKSALLAKEADLVCAFDLTGTSRTETLHIISSPIGVITPPGHPLAKKRSVSLSDCIAYPIIAPSSDWLNHSILHELFDDNDHPFQIAARVERIGMLKNLVQAGLGIAFLSSIGLAEGIQNRTLAWTPLAEGIVKPTTVSLLIPRGRVLPGYLRTFIDILKLELANVALDSVRTGD